MPCARDLILVRDLTIEAIIGIEPHERTTRQPVIIALDLAADVRAAALTEDIASALNYDALTQRVRAFVESSDCRLIETLAERIAALVVHEFGVAWLRLELMKPDALPGSTRVGVVIERTGPEPLADAAPRQALPREGLH